MIITRQRDWQRILDDLESVQAKTVFVMGCGQCATVAHTGGHHQVDEMAAALKEAGYKVVGTTVGDVACHLGGTRLEIRKHGAEVEDADAFVVLTCGAGVQTVSDTTPEKPVFPGLESMFLGNVQRAGVFEERCQMCGDCVLDRTAGICPVTTCPKGLLNGPCGGMWNGQCEVLRDRQCTHVRIFERLALQGRGGGERTGAIPPKNYSAKLKPGSLDLREKAKAAAAAARDAQKDTPGDKDAQ